MVERAGTTLVAVPTGGRNAGAVGLAGAGRTGVALATSSGVVVALVTDTGVAVALGAVTGVRVVVGHTGVTVAVAGGAVGVRVWPCEGWDDRRCLLIAVARGLGDAGMGTSVAVAGAIDAGVDMAAGVRRALPRPCRLCCPCRGERWRLTGAAVGVAVAEGVSCTVTVWRVARRP